MRCASTRRAVYLQHRETGRLMTAGGFPDVVEFMLRPGSSRVVYARMKEVDPYGEWTGQYLYKADRPGWRMFRGERIRVLGLRLMSGESAFDVFADQPDPYELR